MSLPRPSGLKAPSKIGRPSGLPSVAPAVTKSAILTGIPAASKAQSAIAKSARAAGLGLVSGNRYAAEVAPVLRGDALNFGPEPEESIVISEDDFKIGDRVWVSGSKPGIIAFIGETQFAPGEWAGVVLDDPVGKNDGSVMGVRYFQCEMKRGVFSRLSKLTATPQPQAADSATNSATSQPTRASFSSLDGTTNGIALSGSAATSPTALTSTPRLGLGSSRAQSGSSSSLHKASPPASTANLHSPSPSAAAARVGLKIGDKVLISGSKPGVLKYVGETDFAKGVWAGVELDEPLGKNDGAVAGKRYFDCKPMHGLFAPVHKVARLAGAMSVSTPSPGSRSLGLRSARERSTSQESVSSISSSASSVSRSRVRLGVTSLTNQANKSGQRPSTLNLSATTAALQKALKEKEEHIEQLLRERDLERSEVARAAAQVDEAEGQLTNLKSEQERFRGDAEDIIVRLRLQVAELEKEKEALSTKLEDERRRVEDLQFQIEEEVICKDDLETTKEEDEIRMRELEKSFFREKSRADELEKELKTLKMLSEKHQNHLKDTEATQSLYLDQIEDLTYKLTQAENRIKQFESSRLEEGAKSSQVGVELSEKMSRICELEDLVSGQRRDLKHAQDRLQEVQEELTASNNRCKKLQDTLDEVTNKVHGMENQHSKIHDELCSAKSQTCDLQRQLAANKEKTAELAEERNRVEQQIADLMKNSGDSSKQLSTLNGQLAEKTRKLEEQQNDLLSYSQQIAKLNETLEETQRAKDREREGIVHKFEEQMKSLQSQLEDMQLELEKSRNKLTKVTEEAEQERAEIIGRKEAEIQQLKQRMEAQTEEVNKHELQTQAHKEYLEKVCIELESVKYEKEKAEKAVRRIEGERDVFNTELIQVKVMLSKLQSQNTDVQKTISAFEEQVQNLQAEKDHIMHSKQEVEKQRDDLRAEKDRISHDREALHKDYIILKAEMQKRDIQIDEMKKEMERLQQMTEKRQEELMQRSQTEADMLTEELEDSKKILKETHASLKEKESEVIKLKAEVEISKLVIEERKRLEDENVRLKKELEDLNESYRKQVVNLENERTTLHGRADNFSQELSKQKKLLEEQSAQLAALKSENQLLLEKKSALETQDSTISSDKKILADRVVKLEEALAVAEKIRANTALQSGEPASSVQLEKDVDSSQVEFLNSVIVDLQRKNKEMEARLEAMTSGTLDGVADNELIGIPGRRSKPAPRLFCDICDMFDQHDTDDCPKQAMSDSPPPTFNHGERKSLRPYCEICEYFIDPNAVDKHTHSQLADAFFRQCIGFTSDDDVDSELSQESSNGTRSGSGSPQKRGVHLPSLILSRADSLKCSEEKLRNETAHDPISKPLSDLTPRSGGENVPEEKEGVKNIASLGADRQLAGGKNQSVQDGELEDDMKLMSQNASVGEKTALGNYTEDEEYFSDSTLQEDLINTKSFQQTAPYESSPDIETSRKELIANKTPSLFETGSSSLSGNNSSENVSSLNTYANQKTPEMARKVESKLKEKSYLPFSTPESTTPDRDLQSPTLELDEPESTSKADGSVLTPEVDKTIDFDHSKITSVSDQKLSCDIPRSPVSIINKTKTVPISVDTKGQDIGEGGQPEKEDKGEKRGKPQEKGEKRDKPQEKGEKRDKPLEKEERRDKSQEKQEQIKKRASTGASPGENGAPKDASSPGNERPESCIIS